MDSWKSVGAAALTIALGSVGGALATFLSLPAGWLVGSMIVCAALVLAGAPLSLPDWVRQAIFVLLGVSMLLSGGAEMLPRSWRYVAGALRIIALVGWASCVIALLVVLARAT